MSSGTFKSKHASKAPPKSPKSKQSLRSDSSRGTDAPRDRKYFLKHVQSIWHIQAAELPELDSKELLKDDDKILELKAEARQLYEKLTAEFEESMQCFMDYLIQSLIIGYCRRLSAVL